MARVEGAKSFQTSGGAYDRFMGRYSRLLSDPFIDAVGVTPGQTVLDVGCGPGALTGALVERFGADAIAAFDPSGPFVTECGSRYPGVDVRFGRAESIPFDDASVDVAMAQLVLHFVAEPRRVAGELRRVLRSGGVAGLSVWDSEAGMDMLRHFWSAARTVDATAPHEADVLRYGGVGDMAGVLGAAGFVDIEESTISVTSSYLDFDDLWTGFLAGIGPAGAYCNALEADLRDELRAALFASLDRPAGGFTLGATARCVTGRSPGK